MGCKPVTMPSLDHLCCLCHSCQVKADCVTLVDQVLRWCLVFPGPGRTEGQRVILAEELPLQALQEQVLEQLPLKVSQGQVLDQMTPRHLPSGLSLSFLLSPGHISFVYMYGSCVQCPLLILPFTWIFTQFFNVFIIIIIYMFLQLHFF